MLVNGDDGLKAELKRRGVKLTDERNKPLKKPMMIRALLDDDTAAVAQGAVVVD